MKPEAIKQELEILAATLGYDHPLDVLESITQGASFGTMQANAKRYANPRGSETFKDPAAFFSSGTSNKWEKHLSHSEVALYDDRIAELLPRKNVVWLENGATGLSA